MDAIVLIPSIRWELKVGDPTPLAWATVASYLLAAVGCALCARRAEKIFKTEPIRLHRFIWWFLCAVLLFLGVNKQLDLQTLFTQTIKHYAWDAGLYEQGKRAQKYFVLGLAAISLGGIGWGLWKVRGDRYRYIFLALGVLLIVRFVLVRVGKFYRIHIPSMAIFPGRFRLNPYLEITGVLIIAAAAFINLKSSSHE